MRVAVIGAGLCGLAVSYFLDAEVTVFDRIGVGGGASGVAAGLLHPCPGKEGKRSLYADEAMEQARELLKVAEDAYGAPVADCSGIEGKEEGITVWMDRYLEGLFLASGAELSVELIDTIPEGFDAVVFTVGAGIASFCPWLKVDYLKGQLIECEGSFERSVIDEGYVAVHPEKVFVGSTYERRFESEEPDYERAMELLGPRVDRYGLKPLRALSGVRVCRQGHYLPMVFKLEENVWALTAMGSRGLLYHAMYGKKLANALMMSHHILS
ncbi:MAG: FAD-dependent oxidoreductase [Simkaniaceae bacterium]|nr:FAD-dependent oxidoreductase [Simkaniaceae bacterium]